MVGKLLVVVAMANKFKVHIPAAIKLLWRSSAGVVNVPTR